MRWRRVLTTVLLLPVLPILQWGPFTHPYINKKALEIAKGEAENGNKSVNLDLVRACESHWREFVYGANSPDIIANFHITNGIWIYDYAHNYSPNNVRGIPGFGCSLIDKWYEHENTGRYDESQLAAACGWLGHQIADFYPHCAPIDLNGALVANQNLVADEVVTFSGYSDAHRVLGTDYYPALYPRAVSANHALTELFHDIRSIRMDKQSTFRLYADPSYTVATVEGLMGDCETRPLPADNLLTATSERYMGLCVRIPPEHIPYMVRNFHYVISMVRIVAEWMILYRPDFVDSIDSILDESMLERSILRVYERIFLKDRGYFRDQSKRFAANLATYYERERPWIHRMDKSGSQLFAATSDLKKKIPELETENILEILRDPVKVVPSKILRVVVRIFYPFVQADVATGMRRAAGYGISRLPVDEALRNYIFEIIVDPKSTVDSALRGYQSGLRPRVSLVDKLDKQIDLECATVSDLIDSGEIRVKFSPAGSTSGMSAERQRRALDPSSMIFRIDGYDVARRPDLYQASSLSFLQNDPLGEAVAVCRLKKALRGEFHHIFADIKDRSGIGAERLDLELRLGRSTNGQHSRGNSSQSPKPSLWVR